MKGGHKGNLSSIDVAPSGDFPFLNQKATASLSRLSKLSRHKGHWVSMFPANPRAHPLCRRLCRLRRAHVDVAGWILSLRPLLRIGCGRYVAIDMKYVQERLRLKRPLNQCFTRHLRQLISDKLSIDGKNCVTIPAQATQPGAIPRNAMVPKHQSTRAADADSCDPLCAKREGAAV